MNNKPEYEVGYGRPPKDSQFKKGERRKPAPPQKQDDSFGALVRRMFAKRVRVTENGKTKWTTMGDAIVTAQVNAAAKKGDSEILDLLAELSGLLDEAGKRPSSIVKVIKDEEHR